MDSKDYTRFEKARILGARALQISMGAPLLVHGSGMAIDPLAIATMEFENDLIPITARRTIDDYN
jgi:DNA-directed RNA polymerase subunit K